MTVRRWIFRNFITGPPRGKMAWALQGTLALEVGIQVPPLTSVLLSSRQVDNCRLNFPICSNKSHFYFSLCLFLQNIAFQQTFFVQLHSTVQIKGRSSASLLSFIHLLSCPGRVAGSTLMIMKLGTFHCECPRLPYSWNNGYVWKMLWCSFFQDSGCVGFPDKYRVPKLGLLKRWDFA